MCMFFVLFLFFAKVSVIFRLMKVSKTSSSTSMYMATVLAGTHLISRQLKREDWNYFEPITFRTTDLVIICVVSGTKPGFLDAGVADYMTTWQHSGQLVGGTRWTTAEFFFTSGTCGSHFTFSNLYLDLISIPEVRTVWYRWESRVQWILNMT